MKKTLIEDLTESGVFGYQLGIEIAAMIIKDHQKAINDGTANKLIDEIDEIVRRAPEINFSNYDTDQIIEQDSALIQVANIIHKFKISRADI